MPIYSYKCEKCGETFDFLQRFSDPKKTECPKCKENTLHKMLTTSSFSIKGEGVYSQGFSGRK